MDTKRPLSTTPEDKGEARANKKKKTSTKNGENVPTGCLDVT